MRDPDDRLIRRHLRSIDVEIGYLTPEGHIVVTDSIGHKVLFHAYRIDEAQRTFELLGAKRPMDLLGEVMATAYLHRNGWTSAGEALITRSPARLYRLKTSHLLVGANWRSIQFLCEDVEPFVRSPYLSTARQEPAVHSDTQPFFVIIEDLSVRGQQQSGKIVELLGTEQREFLQFVLGKLRIVLEFDSELGASSFASSFLPAGDLAVLDSATRVDVSRSTELVPTKPEAGSPSGSKGTSYRREVLEVQSRWPFLAWEHWAEDPRGHAASFAAGSKQLGIGLDPNRFDLESLDAYLRKLAPDTLFGAFLMDASAYVGEAFVAALGSRPRHRWAVVQLEGGKQTLHHVLYFDEVNYYVSPPTWIAGIWERKEATTLHSSIAQATFDLRTLLAFRQQAEFTALGFISPVENAFKGLRTRVLADGVHANAKTGILGEARVESRILTYGEFLVYFVTGEAIEASGTRYLPIMAVPFARHTQLWSGVLDGAAPRSPSREDVAILRLQGNDLVPLGVQLVNYAEVGPAFTKHVGPLGLRAIAAADKGQVITPRLRQARPEFKDFLAPLDGQETGVPLSPYASILGRIEAVEEQMNPLTNLHLWLLRLDVEGFRCEVFVRKDRCEGIPTPGSYFTGRVWLAAQVEPEAVSTASYIR